MASHPAPLPGHVHLILATPSEATKGETLYLEAPINIINANSLNRRKYLRYLGWCVLGIEGVLVEHQTGDEVISDGELVDLEDQAIYRYDVGDQDPLSRAVDIDVVLPRSHTPSESESTRDGSFREGLLRRDGHCVWTGLESLTAMHIIPFRRTKRWLDEIIENRRPGRYRMDINDIRNGILATSSLHDYFDKRQFVILKTPNPILTTRDIPRFENRTLLSDVSYPMRSRYTFHWIAAPGPMELVMFPNNNDAAFKDHSDSEPYELLLHYNYGAAVMKWWGKNTRILDDRPNKPGPALPIPAPLGPERKILDRSITTGKLRNSRGLQQASQNAGNPSGGAAVDEVQNLSNMKVCYGRTDDFDAQEPWDEDDMMMFIARNLKVNRERRAREEMEHKRFMEDWRNGVST